MSIGFGQYPSCPPHEDPIEHFNGFAEWYNKKAAILEKRGIKMEKINTQEVLKDLKKERE